MFVISVKRVRDSRGRMLDNSTDNWEFVCIHSLQGFPYWGTRYSAKNFLTKEDAEDYYYSNRGKLLNRNIQAECDMSTLAVRKVTYMIASKLN